jgi:glycosyltransferase involved in cell wall biosynthesis
MDLLSLCWRPHNRRAKSLADDIGARLFLAPNLLRNKLYAPFRYVYLTIWTIMILLRHRPDLVIATAPPHFCPLTVFLYAKLFNGIYVVDANHLATTGYWSKIPLGFWFNRFLMNQAIVTLVHNEATKELTDALRIRSIVLEDKIPDLHATNECFEKKDLTIVVPCSFDPDEPIEEVFQAAMALPEARFYFTGNPSRMPPKLHKRRPANVIMTGFLPEKDYDALLNVADLILVLSKDDYPVRPRGAGEAVAVEKPIIVSRNRTTEHHFYKGACLVNNNCDEIVKSIVNIRDNYETFKKEITDLKHERIKQYQQELAHFRKVIGHG